MHKHTHTHTNTHLFHGGTDDGGQCLFAQLHPCTLQLSGSMLQEGHCLLALDCVQLHAKRTVHTILHGGVE
eukprot:1160514-Pelagomonas_calceolata.AAC.11